MIVRTLAEAEKSERCVKAENGNWQSVRLSLKDDKMGHSFNITTIFKGTKTHIHYKNHWESVYVISGNGKIETIADGKVYDLTPGTIYPVFYVKQTSFHHREHRGPRVQPFSLCAPQPLW